MSPTSGTPQRAARRARLRGVRSGVGALESKSSLFAPPRGRFGIRLGTDSRNVRSTLGTHSRHVHSGRALNPIEHRVMRGHQTRGAHSIVDSQSPPPARCSTSRSVVAYVFAKV